MAFRRKVTQSDLRKAMTEAKKKVGTVKRIESPLAKYTDSGQLMCIVCKSIVHTETIWPVHLNSKSHKDNLICAKKTISDNEKRQRNRLSIAKRSSSPSVESISNKRIKGSSKDSGDGKVQSDLPPDFFDVVAKNVNAASDRSTLDKLNISSTENSREDNNTKAIVHDDGEEANRASLPEGFFDDPRMDAKVRNVDYKDPIEEEWDKFQKVIKEETAQSAQIIADDQAEATTERQIDEIEEQIRHWSRVMDLVRRKEEVQKDSEKPKECASDGVSSNEDEEYDEFLDWRAKNSYR